MCTHPLTLLAFGASWSWDAQARDTLKTKGSSLEQWDQHQGTARRAQMGCMPQHLPSPRGTHTGTPLPYIALGARRPLWSWKSSVTLEQMKWHH